MDVVVLVPRRPEPWRDRLWKFVRERVETETNWPIVEGFGVPPTPIEEFATPQFPVQKGVMVTTPFNRSACLNHAAREAGDWDVAVILDADTVPDFERLRQAVELAPGKLVCPQDVFRSLSRRGTKAVLAGECAIERAPKRWDYPRPKSSCVVLGRALWDAVGGFDERFEGWGFEDASFYHACQALAGIERIKGPVWHLWHPRSPEKNPDLEAYQANEELGTRYKAARHDAEEMRAILAEPGGPRA